MPRAIRRPKAARGAASSSSGSRSCGKGSEGVTCAPLTRGAFVEEPDLNPGGDPPEDDRNDEEEGSPVPDPTEETPPDEGLPEAD